MPLLVDETKPIDWYLIIKWRGTLVNPEIGWRQGYLYNTTLYFEIFESMSMPAGCP